MPDIDVAAVALTIPPARATLTTYRPTFTVKNNGRAAVLATGFVRIYKAGKMVFTSEVFTAQIPAGASANAQAYDYWKPTELGKYTTSGYITCPRDSVEANNQLAPVAFEVTSETPPTPPVVNLHASQHEEGGTDELNIDGLPGTAADKQHPLDHADQHSSGGDDELDVTGLHGVLADGQAVANHANEKHTTPFATVVALSVHEAATSCHALAANLEKTAKKNAANGYAGLDSGSLIADSQVPATVERTANKAQANGYAPLDATSKVPAANLGGIPITAGQFLRSDQSWADVPSAVSFATPVEVKAGFTNSEGQSQSAARADHSHSASGLLLADISSSIIGPGQDAYAVDYNLPAVTEKLVLTLRHCAIAVSHVNSYPLDFRVNLANLNLHLVSWSIVAGQSLSVLVTAKIILDPVARTVSSCLTIENVSVVLGQLAGKVDVYRSPATQWDPTQTNRLYLRIYNNSITTGEWLLAASAVEAQKV